MAGLNIDIIEKGIGHSLELSKVKELVEVIYKKFLKKGEYRLNLILVNDEEIQRINKKYRQKDQVTDVLSFAEGDIKTSFPIVGGVTYLGDIFISINQGQRQAQEYGVSVEKEFYLLCIHGILHLLGYDHIEDKEAKIMEDMENKILSNLFN